MKIIHTADWHLGQNFYEFDRKKEHLHFFSQLKKIIVEKKAEVLLVAGDVFDSPNPPADAQEMYYHFLHELTTENRDLQVIIIAGNHDSAARLEAPNPLLKAMNIHVRGIVKRNDKNEIDYTNLIIPLMNNKMVTGYCLAVPYLRYGDTPLADNYTRSVGLFFEELYKSVPDKTLPVIAMSHLQASGAMISQNDKSERLVIGGEEGIAPEAIPQGIVYTALGHLHKAQRIPHRDNIRYAGAPLPMSFAERTNKSGVVFIEITENNLQIEKIEIQPLVSFQSIHSKSKEDLIHEVLKLPNGDKTDAPYLELIVKISEPEPSLRNHIEELLEPKAVRLARLACYTKKEETSDYYSPDIDSNWQMFTPFDMATAIFKRKGFEMSETMQTLLKQAIKETETEEKS